MFIIIHAGEMIWSKLDSGRLPNLQEITLHIEKQDQQFASQHDEKDGFSFPEDNFQDGYSEI